jgi:hypothetical protein
MPPRPLIVPLLAAVLAAACGDAAVRQVRPQAGTDPLPKNGEPVKLDPAEFTTRIDNPYFPMAPGTRWEYREGSTHVVVDVTHQTRKVAGITARVVHDVDRRGGRLVEDTRDWYAQDAHGNVWYLGEDTKEYRNGKVHTIEGSWEAGVDGAQAGVIMPARPRVGMDYRQEYYKGHAEDAARILSLHRRVKVPVGRFANVLETLDYTPLEPRVSERKHYAKGIGPVLSISKVGHVSEVLVRFKAGS